MSGRRIALVLFLSVVVGACGAATNAEPEARVTAEDSDAVLHRMIDGDSLELDVGGQVVEVRMIGINAPEASDCQGPAAREALKAVIDGRSIGLESFGSDRFGRLLVEMFVDGSSVNEAMVRAGWALALHGDERDWTTEMKSAASDGLGMWDAPTLCPSPAGVLRISDIQPDPPGPDDEVLIDEWIEIENRGSEVVDLGGWTVRDESTRNRFVLATADVAPGATVKIRTGCGADTSTDIHWCSDNGVWSNRGETALLLGPSGAIVDVRFLD